MQQRFQNADVEAGLRKDFCKKSFNKNTQQKPQKPNVVCKKQKTCL
jgi:hypothetical protein